MKPCPIFATFTAAGKIWKEVDALIETFQSNLAKSTDETLEINKLKWGEDSEGSYYWCNALLDIRTEASGKPKSRWLTLTFDLVRDVPKKQATNWPYARHSLLVVSFSPLLSDNWWQAEDARVTPYGILANRDTWAECKNHRFGGNRLLEWAKYSKGKAWSERAWLFATPLNGINDQDGVWEELIKPVSELLVHNRPESLTKTSAVVWAKAAEGGDSKD